MILWLVSAAWAFPTRAPLRPDTVEWEPGRERDVLVVKLVEGATFDPDEPLLEGSEPLFRRAPEAIRADRARRDPNGLLADLTLYRRLESADAENRGTLLLADARVETAYLAFAPVRPPASDIPPSTPDFVSAQRYLGPPPAGLGFEDAWTWTGGRGDAVAIADIEYAWRSTHEDLGHAAGALTLGWNSGAYEFHGTGVLGELFGGDNGYGIVGMASEARPIVVSPFSDVHSYDVAAMIDATAAELEPGDVILIEQQSFSRGNYCPVEIDPAVWDAIALAVAGGIVVVEPGGNGGQDLDDPKWDGWFQREERDSGAILVGGGASPLGLQQPRAWFTNGSSYGSRIDLQGWYDQIATATTDYNPDLFFPGDYDQAYTSTFGGTSGASPMVAACAAIANSVAIHARGEPWDPWELREALRNTGTPQPADDAAVHPIGPQPDMRRFLRTWAVR
jgi:serine protease